MKSSRFGLFVLGCVFCAVLGKCILVSNQQNKLISGKSSSIIKVLNSIENLTMNPDDLVLGKKKAYDYASIKRNSSDLLRLTYNHSLNSIYINQELNEHKKKSNVGYKKLYEKSQEYISRFFQHLNHLQLKLHIVLRPEDEHVFNTPPIGWTFEYQSYLQGFYCYNGDLSVDFDTSGNLFSVRCKNKFESINNTQKLGYEESLNKAKQLVREKLNSELKFRIEYLPTQKFYGNLDVDSDKPVIVEKNEDFIRKLVREGMADKYYLQAELKSEKRQGTKGYLAWPVQFIITYYLRGELIKSTVLFFVDVENGEIINGSYR